MSKNFNIKFALVASLFLILFLGFLGIITEIIRPKNVVIGFSDGRLLFISNQSYVQTQIIPLSDLCLPFAITRDGKLFKNEQFLTQLPMVTADWCAWKRQSLYVGSPLGVYQVYPILKKQLWTLHMARYVCWKNDEWLTSEEPFKYNDETGRQIRIQEGFLMETELSKRWVGTDAIALDWNS